MKKAGCKFTLVIITMELAEVKARIPALKEEKEGKLIKDKERCTVVAEFRIAQMRRMIKTTAWALSLTETVAIRRTRVRQGRGLDMTSLRSNSISVYLSP